MVRFWCDHYYTVQCSPFKVDFKMVLPDDFEFEYTAYFKNDVLEKINHFDAWYSVCLFVLSHTILYSV